MYWIFKIETETSPAQFFIGTKQHIDSLIADKEPVEYFKKYDTPIKSADKKLIIAGSGRSGTTFLVQLLTRLNYHTGYMPYEEAVYEYKRAGCEYGVKSLGECNNPKKIISDFSHHPFILKTPSMSWYLKMITVILQIPVGHVMIPVRDHREAATSRIKENLHIPLIGKDLES